MVKTRDNGGQSGHKSQAPQAKQSCSIVDMHVKFPIIVVELSSKEHFSRIPVMKKLPPHRGESTGKNTHFVAAETRWQPSPKKGQQRHIWIILSHSMW
jgi:hypothetical protein